MISNSKVCTLSIPSTDYLTAFLLNCDPDDSGKESEGYAIESITQKDDGSWEVKARTKNTEGKDYNGMSVILGSESIEDPDWDDANVDGPFFKAELQVKPAAENDLAFTLMQMGRFDEAEPFAREAVKAVADSWQFRETLAAILIRTGRTEEGERELAKAEELAEKGGFKKDLISEFALDRAWLKELAAREVEEARLYLNGVSVR